MRRSLAVAATLVGLVLVVAGPAQAEPSPKGEQKKSSSGLLETLKGVPPVLGKNGVNNR